MEALGEEGNQSQSSCEHDNSSQRAQAAVTKLQELNSRYFENHSLDDASRKLDDVTAELKETLTLLDSLEESLPKAEYWCLKGSALNVQPDFCQEAEDCLSKAIKHDPTLITAWNCLGETYWKAGKTREAHDCFVGSLAHLKNKKALRNLSIVLRLLGKDETERAAKIRESVERAKEAVEMDVKDGTSWMVLGNAYIALFFTGNQDPKVLKQCSSAYSQAEKDLIAHNNPDLHFNKATLYQYEEDYNGMLQELSLSSALDPSWSTPRDQKEAIVKFLKAMVHFIDCKGKAKPKVLSSLMSKLVQSSTHLGEESAKMIISYPDLKEGTNSGRVFLGAVVCVIQWKERVPYACVMIDVDGTAVGLTIYNLSQTANLHVGDVLTIADPVFKHILAQNNSEVIQFSAVRVDKPHLLLVNGQKLSRDKLAKSEILITPFT